MGMAAHGKMRNLRNRHLICLCDGCAPPSAGLYRAAAAEPTPSTLVRSLRLRRARRHRQAGEFVGLTLSPAAALLLVPLVLLGGDLVVVSFPSLWTRSPSSPLP